jgi:hypothetical protein
MDLSCAGGRYIIKDITNKEIIILVKECPSSTYFILRGKIYEKIEGCGNGITSVTCCGRSIHGMV